MGVTSIVMGITGFLCGGIFTFLGVRALLLKKPVGFWAGTKIDPASVSDVKKYNRANAKMWLIYSVPYWFAGIAGLFNDTSKAASYIFLILLILASSGGLWWVLIHYHKIETDFIS